MIDTHTQNIIEKLTSGEDASYFSEVVAAYDAGILDKDAPSVSLDTLIGLGWHDWFCHDGSLIRRGRTLIQRAKKLANAGGIAKDKVGFFMKNNSPISGGTYDTFGFTDIETKQAHYVVVPRREVKRYSSRERRMITERVECELWGKENEFDSPLVYSTDWKDVVDYFKGVPAAEIRERSTSLISQPAVAEAV
ncbi:MAG: hypothetical protein LC687_04750 [Actinobacteria bacterium]|nr:hypothetical protein [Actinomycetota bacterium]MCA1807143.1 hypothetical protein [Actinomycetota bacterium]